MEPLIDRARLISRYFVDLVRHGLPEMTGRVDREALFILDGVGRFQAAPLMVRRALREEGSTLGTVLVDWQFGLPGEIWTDLMWLRRNRLMGLRLARRLRTFRRDHPQTTIHLLAFSGGAGTALFACERLQEARRRSAACSPTGEDRPFIETLVLACPAVSATYNLGAALRAVQRCYALVSRRDTLILGLGTSVFGTTDRCFASAAGRVGFRLPSPLSDEDARAYRKLSEIRWSPAFKREGHYGGHTGPANVRFLRRHLLPLLHGDPRLPVHAVEPGEQCSTRPT